MSSQLRIPTPPKQFVAQCAELFRGGFFQVFTGTVMRSTCTLEETRVVPCGRELGYGDWVILARVGALVEVSLS
jgi:hypothetical protein